LDTEATSAPTDPADALAAVGPGDTTGTETLARYEYQIKVAVHRWLATLASDSESRIVCEFVDDITTLSSNSITFAQVKTRDRGSWSVSKIFQDGGGLDALARSYRLARKSGCHELVQLELILEGPPGTGQDTRRFFANPSSVTADERKRVAKLGVPDEDVADFLGRLTITTQYHARQSIDGVTLNMVMSLVGGHTADVVLACERLHARAREAHLGLADVGDGRVPLALQGDPVGDAARMSAHALTRAELLSILPPVPELVAEQRALLAAASGGASGVSDLNFKLQVAGAGSTVIAKAQDKRARATAQLAEQPSIEQGPDTRVEVLERKVLEHAEAVVAEVAATSPQLRGRTGEVVFSRLVQQQAMLAGLDTEGVFKDGESVLGFLCETSDRCKFAWRPT
jgi:hypothetical protein